MNRYLFLLASAALFAAEPSMPDSAPLHLEHAGQRHKTKKKKSRRDALPSTDAFLSPEGHFKAFNDAFAASDFKTAMLHSGIIESNFRTHASFKNHRFDAAMAYYKTDHFVEANRALTDYLVAGLPEHFQDALSYKFEIAQKFSKNKSGKYPMIKKIFTERSFPERAIEIYNDIVLFAPASDIAAYALFHKGQVEMSVADYDDSIDTFRRLIHDFIGHDLLPQAYYGVAQSYFGKYSEMRSKTPDLIDLAHVNLELFEQAYPTHELYAKSRELHQEMRSLLAWELYEVGHYFQRRKKPKAAALYYQKICQQYPDTPAAQHCHEKHEDLLSTAG